MRQSKSRNDDGCLLTYEQVSKKFNLGTNTVMNLAKESGALIKIGRCSRIDPVIFEKYIREKYSVKG